MVAGTSSRVYVVSPTGQFAQRIARIAGTLRGTAALVLLLAPLSCSDQSIDPGDEPASHQSNGSQPSSDRVASPCPERGRRPQAVSGPPQLACPRVTASPTLHCANKSRSRSRYRDSDRPEPVAVHADLTPPRVVVSREVRTGSGESGSMPSAIAGLTPS